MQRRRVARLCAALLVLAVATSCSDDGGGGGGGDAPKLVAPAAFADRMQEPGVVTINVHTPDEGSIPGTDLAIPFDQIATSTELPENLDTPLAVYCRSGNMSADAVDDLEALGYTDIVELDGGFNAWRDAGRDFTPAD